MSSEMLSDVWQHSRARSHAYALLQAVASNANWQDSSTAELDDQWLIDWLRITPKQFEQAREQLYRLHELEYWPSDKAGRMHYRITLLPGKRKGAG